MLNGLTAPNGTFMMGVFAHEVTAVWDDVRPMLQKAFDRFPRYHDMTPESIRADVESGDMQMWVVHDGNGIIAVAITQILLYPGRKVFTIPLVASEANTIEQWIDYLRVFEEFAREKGCAVIRGWGRAGWVKRLNPDDVRVEFDIEVSNENIH